MLNHMKRTAKILLCAALILAAVVPAALLTGCGSKEVTVPDVVGMTQEEAEQTLADAGLTLNVKRERYSDTHPEGTVDKMVTPAGETAASGDEIQVIMSMGEGVTVPNMWVLTGAEAANLLTKVGLNPVIVEEYSDEVEAGGIINYTDSGQIIAKGSDVTLTVSKGPEA